MMLTRNPDLFSEVTLDLLLAATILMGEIFVACLYLYATSRMPVRGDGRMERRVPAS